jgi:hypothetical protein
MKSSLARILLASAVAGAFSCSSSSGPSNIPDAAPDRGVSDGATPDASLSDSAAPDGAVAWPTKEPLDGFTMADLPAGKPCAAGSPACSIAVNVQCGDTSDPGDVNGWTCGCNNDRWDCVITSPGLGGGCSPDGFSCPPSQPVGVSNTCIVCCDPGGKLVDCLSSCTNYFACYYCMCGSDTKCQEGCAPLRTSACDECYVKLADCENSSCKSECAGQPFHDAGVE